MQYRYGTLPPQQIEEYKKWLHKKVFWLLVYKDPKTADKYSHVNFEQYVERLMEHLEGMNKLLNYPPSMLLLMSSLQSVLQTANEEPFDYQIFRRKVLEAHTFIDQLDKGVDK